MMSRIAVRIAAAMSLVLLVAACDKCGNVTINVPGMGPKACSDGGPRG